MNVRFALSLIVLAAALPAGAETAPVAAPGAVSVATATVKTDVLPAEKTPAGLKAEVKVGTGIENKEPVGVQENYPPKTTELVAWSRVTGANGPTTVTHVWIRNGDEVKRTDLQILSSSYRTHSSMTVAKLPGNWSVEVRDKSGKVIGSTDFNVMDK